ncbi:ABC transporter substrate-binding protein [Corynebacterium flavescens]
MKLRRTTFVLTALVASSLALASCSSSASSGNGENGTLTFALANDPLVFNPSANGNGNDTWYVTRQIFDSLVYLNPASGELEPWLAESWESNPDATEFTFKLRDGVTFSDGSPLKAQTIASNFDDIKAAGAQSAAVAALRDYAGSEVIDDSTVSVRFNSPNAAFLSAAAGVPLSIVSEKSLEIPYADRASGKNVIGSGPFTLGSYTKDSEVNLEKREGYTWAPTSFSNRGDAHFDAVKFQIIPESGNRTGGLSSGQIDAAGSIAPNDIDSVEASNSIVYRANPGTVFGLYLNYDLPLFADEKVREAVALAVDSPEIRDGALNDRFNVATSPLASTTKDYADVSADIPQHNVDKAKELLDQAGWTTGENGIRSKDAKELNFRITYINNFGPNADSIALLQEQLRQVGISSTQVVGTVPEFQANVASGDYEIAWRNLSSVDGDVLRGDFGEIGSDSNFPIPDEQLQLDLQNQVAIGDEAQRKEALAGIQQELVEKNLFIPVHELTTVIGVADDITGLSLGADSRLNPLIDAERIS